MEHADGDHQQALASLQAAVTAAEEGRYDRMRALAWIWEINVDDELGSAAEARRAAEQARAVLSHVKTDFELEAQLEVALGIFEQNNGDVAKAAEHVVRGLALAERALGPDHPRLADYLSQMVMPLMILGDYDGAERAGRRAMEIIEKHWGKEHPSWAREEAELASLALPRGQVDEAVRLSRDALTRLEQAYGPVAEQLNHARDILNSGLRALGRIKEALVVAKQMGDDSSDCLGLLTVGGTELEARHFDAAERALDEVVRRLSAREGPPHTHLFKAKVRLARIYLERHQVARARAACEEAARGLPESDEWGLLDSQPCLAEVEEAERHYAPALARMNRVIQILEKNHTSDAPWGVGEQRVAAARLLWKLHRGDEARSLLERALAGEPHPPVGVTDSMIEARLLLARLEPRRAEKLTAEAAALAARQEFPQPQNLRGLPPPVERQVSPAPANFLQ
jgi:tetratricopeptide (TPR) repeat protein